MGQEIIKYSGCFVCGDKNPEGLRIQFFLDGDDAVAECTAEPRFQGFKGIYHGGLISTLLDEIMAKAVLARRKYAMTVEITVRYRKAVPVGENLVLRGRIKAEKGRLFEAEGTVSNPAGVVFATATGRYLEASSAMRQKLKESIE
jgi:acyl-coenzyme A thioesterase PaaI-like protein